MKGWRGIGSSLSALRLWTDPRGASEGLSIAAVIGRIDTTATHGHQSQRRLRNEPTRSTSDGQHVVVGSRDSSSSASQPRRGDKVALR